MKLSIKGKNIELTAALKQYIEDKLGKAQKHLDQKLDINVVLEVSKNPSISKDQIAEATASLNGKTVHVSEASENMYASIDLLADKLDRQIRKYKTKQEVRTKDKVNSIRNTPGSKETEPEAVEAIDS